tara:strand:- start:4059 stop:4400 length:342 start_codon:yes stop_codon:yes gene_type:complete
MFKTTYTIEKEDGTTIEKIVTVHEKVGIGYRQSQGDEGLFFETEDKYRYGKNPFLNDQWVTQVYDRKLNKWLVCDYNESKKCCEAFINDGGINSDEYRENEREANEMIDSIQN